MGGGMAGGFLNTGSDPMAVDSPSKKGRGGALNQSLVPVTVKQLLSATQANAEDAFRIDGKELNQITLVGMILAVNEAATNVSFNLDDGTGKAEVRIWLDQDDQSETAQQRSHWKVGCYIRVIGHLRSFNNKKSVMAFRIQPITDMNEITYHLLDTIYTHLVHTRGNIQGSSSVFSTSSVSHVSNAYTAPQSYNNNLADIHQMVIQCIRNTRSGNEGVTIQYISTAINRTEQQVRASLDFLSGEGHVYSTIDENHYQTTDSV